MAPVKDRDLWQRLDRLVQIHSVECGPGALESANDLAAPPIAARAPTTPRRKSGGRVLRIDAGHRAAQHQAPKIKPTTAMPRCPTNPKFKARNVRNWYRFGHWKIGRWNLFDAWNLVLGILNRKRIRRPKRNLSAR